MFFRAFGIPTTVQLGFWFGCVLLGYPTLRGPHKFTMLVWIGVVFFSIMIHELGHAFAMMRYGLRPEITLHMLGGLTSSHGMTRLSRSRRIFISFAGPLAGFIFYGLLIGVQALLPDLVRVGPDPSTAEIALSFAIYQLEWVNLWWGLVNLIPVLPLDGGHILEDILGPRRAKITATLSLVAGILVVIVCVTREPPMWFIAFIFGMCTVQSYQRFRMASDAQSHAKPKKKKKPEEPVAPEIAEQLLLAKDALADDRYDEAGSLAEKIIEAKPPRAVRVEALDVLGWAHLLEGRAEEAARVVAAIQRDGEADPALAGSVLFHTEKLDEARAVFEAARAMGDDRKEIVGPLIQILIAQGEVPRAAAIALDIVETLSEEDARQMATIAFEHEAFSWAARLSESVFERTGVADDAYDAARSRSLEGDLSGALVLLRRAVAAGFSDAARVWSDKALEALRNNGESEGELEALLPRP